MHLHSNQKDQDNLYSMYKDHRKELQERNGAIRELEASLPQQYEELCAVRFERDSANQQIQEHENKKCVRDHQIFLLHVKERGG
jgi:hypothetical protein